MKSQTNLSLASIPLFILTISIFSVAVDPQVKKICDTTLHPDLCLTTVAPFVKGNPNKKNVLQVAIQVSEKLAKEDVAVVKKLLEKPGIPPPVLSTLKFCISSYEDAVSDFDMALAATGSNDMSTVVSQLGAIYSSTDDCDDGFKNIGMSSPMADYALKLTDMTDNCMSLVK